jgi:hypothetical protein
LLLLINFVAWAAVPVFFKYTTEKEPPEEGDRS